MELNSSGPIPSFELVKDKEIAEMKCIRHKILVCITAKKGNSSSSQAMNEWGTKTNV